MNKKLFFLVFLCFFVFSLGTIAQEKGMMEVIQEKELMRIQAEEQESGNIIYVDDSIGDDDGKGTENKPYKTIGKALEVAEFGDTIKVGPGIYSESLDLRYSGPIIIEGSGKESCTIDGSIFVDVCDYLKIEGFSITGGGPDIAVWLENVDNAIIDDCIIDSYYTAIFIRLHTALWIYDTQIIGHGEKYGALAYAGSYMSLIRCSISGFSQGVVSMVGAETRVNYCEVYNNSKYGVNVVNNARLYLNGSEIHDNQSVGVAVRRGGDAQLVGNNKIYGHSYSQRYGIDIRYGGHVFIEDDIEIYSNWAGINVNEAGILKLQGENISITGNESGVLVKGFSSAFLGETSISGNTWVDVGISEGGQATCNPDNITILDSDCPYCQK